MVAPVWLDEEECRAVVFVVRRSELCLLTTVHCNMYATLPAGPVDRMPATTKIRARTMPIECTGPSSQPWPRAP